MTDATSDTRLLIVEPNFHGHYLVYVRLLAEYGLERGMQVTIALHPRALASLEFRHHLAHLDPSIVETLDGPVEPRTVSKLAQRVGADRTVVPNGDRFAMKLGLGGGWRGPGVVTALVMQDPRFAPGDELVSWAKRSSKKALLLMASRLSSVRVVWLRPPGWSGAGDELVAIDPVILGDPQPNSELVQRLNSLETHCYWFSMVGGITARKNPFVGLEAFERLGAATSGFLLAGRASSDLVVPLRQRLDEMAARGNRVVWLDQVLTNEEMNYAISRVNAVVLPYSTHAPPSTLGKAAAVGTRVIAAGSPAFVSHARGVGVGALTSPLTVDALAQSMREALALGRPAARRDVGIRDFVIPVVGDQGC